MADKNFLISGTAISSSAQGLIKMPTRKFYNAVYFHNNQYHHEIANHYRDFKLRRRIRQRKKLVNLRYYCKVDTAKIAPHEYQQELPMALHIFPSFEKVYEPRGRRTLCAQRRPDLTNNDAIKRIQSANQNAELLKKIAKKQVEKVKQQKYIKNSSNDGETKNVQTANKLNIYKFKQKKEQRRRRSLGKLESVDHVRRQQQIVFLTSGYAVKQTISDTAQPAESSNNSCDCVAESIGVKTLKYYLQLATDYYQQGFLQNIKYLENLAERNQLRRKQQLQLQQQQQQQQQLQLQQQLQQQQKVSRLGDLSAAATNISKLKSNRHESERIGNASLNTSGIRKKQSNQSNPISWSERQQIGKLTVKEYPQKSDKERVDCNIRVNIKPQAVNINRQESFASFNKIYGKRKTIVESKELNSMNNNLNGNLDYIQQQQQQQQQQQAIYHNTVANNRNYPAKVLPLENLIDNLRELDIEDNFTNLPRITLTDYTHKYPNESNSDSLHQHNAGESKNYLNSCVIRQSSLDCSNLNIPLATHYHSEARPP